MVKVTVFMSWSRVNTLEMNAMFDHVTIMPFLNIGVLVHGILKQRKMIVFIVGTNCTSPDLRLTNLTCSLNDFHPL